MKLLLADDHSLFRDTLVQYIRRAAPEADVKLARDFHEALFVIDENPDRDLVMLDLRMPGMDGMEGFKTMRARHPNIPVALMSGVAEREDVDAAMALGAAGYFPKTLSGKSLLQAMQQVMNGDKFIPIDSVSKGIMPSYYADSFEDENSHIKKSTTSGQDRERANHIHLTPREEEVLSYIMDGAANKEIAHELGLQLVTVKLHVRGVCRKLEAKNRTQAAMKAQALGFVSNMSVN